MFNQLQLQKLHTRYFIRKQADMGRRGGPFSLTFYIFSLQQLKMWNWSTFCLQNVFHTGFL